MSDESQDNARSLVDGETRYVGSHQVIKNFALEFCQLLFSVPNPLGFLWSGEEGKSQISIVDKYAFNRDQVGQQPAIVANRGPIAWMKTSGFRQMQSADLMTDERIHTDLVRGGCTLSCFSKAGLEAEDIAGFLFDSFNIFRDPLRKSGNQARMVANHLGFFKIEAATMGEEALIKSTSRPELSVVPVSISAMVQRRWAVTPRNARKLQGVRVRRITSL